MPATVGSLKMLIEEGTRESEDSIVVDSALESRSALDQLSLRKSSSSPVRLRSIHSHSESESYEMRGCLPGDAMGRVASGRRKEEASTGPVQRVWRWRGIADCLPRLVTPNFPCLFATQKLNFSNQRQRRLAAPRAAPRGVWWFEDHTTNYNTRRVTYPSRACEDCVRRVRFHLPSLFIRGSGSRYALVLALVQDGAALKYTVDSGPDC